MLNNFPKFFKGGKANNNAKNSGEQTTNEDSADSPYDVELSTDPETEETVVVMPSKIEESPKSPKRDKVQTRSGEKSPKHKTPKKAAKPTPEATDITTPSAAADDAGHATTAGKEDELGAEDVHKMLEDLEITDFNMSMQIEDDDDDNQDTDSPDNVPLDEVDWSNRLKREEVFSKRYHPNKQERHELSVMGERLGLAPASDLIGMGMRFTLQMGLVSQPQEDLHTLLEGNHSIILSFGEVQWKNNKCDLVVLTDGFILMYRNLSSYNPLEKKYETCQLWKAVKYVERSGFLAMAIQLTSGERLELEAAENGDSVSALFHKLERVITEHDLHGPSSATQGLGWQYERVHKPGFTSAVTGDLKLFGNPATLNALDAYNQMAPLHYALQQETCSDDVVNALLNAGADPNLPDGDGRSAMYYAERNEQHELLEILQNGGGQTSKLAEMEMRGELFGGVEAANRNSDRRRERDQAIKDSKAAEAAGKAESAKSEMNKAMAALLDRGEKIEEIGDKAQELSDEAKTFGGLAAQLKEDAKNKKWYQL